MSPSLPDETPPPNRPVTPPPSTDNRTVLTHVVYGLYALGFVTGFTPLVGVIIAYFNREPTRGTWLDSHGRWQIRTFWYGLLLYAVGSILLLIAIGWLVLLATSVWFVWRIAKGWVRLAHEEPIEDPLAFV